MSFNTCIDCYAELLTKVSLRCKSCSKKGYLNPVFGKKPHNFKGYTLSKSGSRNKIYREITINGKRRKEHRVIMEKHIGRKLLKTEIIHHINGNGLDNSIENLQIVTTKQHILIHKGES